MQTKNHTSKKYLKTIVARANAKEIKGRKQEYNQYQKLTQLNAQTNKAMCNV